jgi:hypothetical protein
VALPGARRVICLKTALAAFDSIITQGEGAQQETENSHYHRFAAIRDEYQALLAADPSFKPAFPAATNPVLRRPPRPEGRVWLENDDAIATVDLANAAYGLMQRLLAYSYAVPAPDPDKSLALDLGVGLMRALAPLAERAARLPAGPSNPDCHAGVTFITLRDASSLPPGPAARRFFRERFQQLSEAAGRLAATRGRRLRPQQPHPPPPRHRPQRPRWPRPHRKASSVWKAKSSPCCSTPNAVSTRAFASPARPRCSWRTCKGRGSSRMRWKWTAWWKSRTPVRPGQSNTSAAMDTQTKPRRR